MRFHMICGSICAVLRPVQKPKAISYLLVCEIKSAEKQMLSQYINSGTQRKEKGMYAVTDFELVLEYAFLNNF